MRTHLDPPYEYRHLASGFLAPFLPYLRAAGEKMAEGALKKFGEDSYNKAKSIWARLGSKVVASPGTAEPLAELERNPRDTAALQAFARQIELLLRADPKLTEEMSVLIGGDVINSTIVVGEKNVLGRVDMDGGDFVLGDKVTNIQAPAPSVSALHQLPPPPSDFTGREEELAELLGKIKKGGVAISGLRGMGGIGKTALALKLADRIKGGYPDAQIYLDLKGASEKPLTVPEILEQIILSFHPDSKLPEDEGQLANIYRSVLEGRRAILLMDNAAGSGQVAPLVPPSGSILLITSRNRFNVLGLFQLDIGELLEEDARDLLLKIAPRIDDSAGEIAELCGYLPLALRAAANLLAVTPGMRVDEYTGLLRDEHTRLEAIGTTDIPAGVEASIGLSYILLAAETQRVFRHLAVFPGSFDKAAEEEICEDAGSRHLMDMERRSLVTYDEEPDRYKLHDLVRLFGDVRLPRDERCPALRRHDVYYNDALATAKAMYREGGEHAGCALELLDAEWANIRAGQVWAAEQSEAEEVAASLCSDYASHASLLSLRQHPRERIRWLEAALAAARRLKDRPSEGAHLGNLGLAYDSLGDYRRAIEYHERCLSIAREIGARLREGRTLGNIGVAYRWLGEEHRAIEYYNKHLAIARETGDQRGEGRALGNLGSAYVSLGKYRRAIGYHEEWLAIAQQVGDRRGEGSALGNLGVAYRSLGEYGRAIDYHKQHLAKAREIGYRAGEGKALYNMSLALEKLGDYAEALANAEAALRIKELIDDPWADKARELADRLRGLLSRDAE